MTNIVNIVWKFLDGSPSIRRNMSLGLINNRALAKYIIKEKKIDTTIDAVISAIRRYYLDTYDEIYEKASRIINYTVISTKSKLANISVVKDTDIQRLLPELFTIIDYNRGDVLRIIQADESIKILIDEKNLEKLESIFPKNKILKIDRDLAEINMHLHKDAVNTPGFIALVSNELAINGINVMETMSCVPEMLWFVKEKDILKAYQVLFEMCH